MTTPTTQLDYARPDPFFTRRRVRWIIVGVVVLTLAVSGVWNRRWLDQKRRLVETLYFQRQCMAFLPPADTVIYDDNPARVADLTTGASAEGLASSTPVREVRFADGHTALFWDDPIYDQLCVRGSRIPTATEGVLFVHECFTPQGGRFIVTCIVAPNPDGSGLPQFTMVDFQPATWSRGIKMRNSYITSLPELNQALSEGKRVKLFAGQPDPADRSHFTIRCEIDGVESFLDGWEREFALDSKGVPFSELKLELRKR